MQSGAFGSFDWLTKESTPAKRLNVAYKFGKTGRASTSGCIKARYSVSASVRIHSHDAAERKHLAQFRFTGESRCPREPWIPAFAGKARSGASAESSV